MFLDPCGCYEIEKELQLKDEDAKNFIEKIQQELRKGLEKSTVIKNPPEVTGRVKSLYSIYRKVCHERGRDALSAVAKSDERLYCHAKAERLPFHSHDGLCLWAAV